MSEKPEKVQFFHTCLINEFYPGVGMSVVNILERLGITVEVPPDQTCCGQPAFNSGFSKEAREVALKTLDILLETEGPIIVPSGSCGDMIIHQYPQLFYDDSKSLAKVNAVTERCYEFTQFLVDVLDITDLRVRLNARAAYHPSCHLLRGLKVENQPKVLLENVTGLDVVEFQDQEECCGFGGMFSVKNPEISGSMMNNKIAHLEAVGADMVISCDMGCLMHLEGGLHRRGSRIQVRHVAQILEEGLAS
ncbi:(Fe-S)-binding protein [candidate division KSB1 bacterium]|nr:(Fe-S)-binding protein [candidate division KSB1 bacterium]NIV70794.1 Fe-S oxidoreductase [Phycisphaerae bacterium]NIR72912.1 (Fe-S)-binding protein [candidate division KSB1 bacterium]NIT73710.1 (Fe-S)-binding protein [candidate division KSB1 bacterium]NIU27582.1 (Fe-S)-binding protein [candidate division KSB1 bacterium]